MKLAEFLNINILQPCSSEAEGDTSAACETNPTASHGATPAWASLQNKAKNDARCHTVQGSFGNKNRGSRVNGELSGTSVVMPPIKASRCQTA